MPYLISLLFLRLLEIFVLLFEDLCVSKCVLCMQCYSVCNCNSITDKNCTIAPLAFSVCPCLWLSALRSWLTELYFAGLFVSPKLKGRSLNHHQWQVVSVCLSTLYECALHAYMWAVSWRIQMGGKPVSCHINTTIKFIVSHHQKWAYKPGGQQSFQSAGSSSDGLAKHEPAE